MSSFKAAFVVVDFQEDFCPPKGSLAIPNGRTIAPLINSLITLPGFALRIATQDWHPTDHISFASNHPAPNNKPFTSKATVANPDKPSEKEEIILWPGHCVQNTPGAELIPEFDTTLVDHIIKKGTDKRVEMFSAFTDQFKVGESGLGGILKKEGITHVYVAGLARDFCVKWTAVDAAKEGFETYVVGDACVAIDESEEAGRGLREELGKHGVEIVMAEEVKRKVG